MKKKKQKKKIRRRLCTKRTHQLYYIINKHGSMKSSYQTRTIYNKSPSGPLAPLIFIYFLLFLSLFCISVAESRGQPEVFLIFSCKTNRSGLKTRPRPPARAPPRAPASPSSPLTPAAQPLSARIRRRARSAQLHNLHVVLPARGRVQNAAPRRGVGLCAAAAGVSWPAMAVRVPVKYKGACRGAPWRRRRPGCAGTAPCAGVWLYEHMK